VGLDKLIDGVPELLCRGEPRDFDLRELSEGASYDIPYRCLVPQEVNGLSVAGRCISTTHEALGSIRVMSHCMALGHAAAVAVREGLQPCALHARQAQKELAGQGANLGDVESEITEYTQGNRQ